MERNEKTKEYAALALKNSNLLKEMGDLVANAQKNLKDSLYNSKELSSEIIANRGKMDDLRKNGIPVLIASVKVENTFFDKDTYANLYYLADLDIPEQKVAFNKNEFLDGTIDFREFFGEIGLPNSAWIYESIALYLARGILAEIVNYMFSVKQYNSWDEVREDLINISESYSKPEWHETPGSYRTRVLNNNGKARYSRV